MINIFTYFVYFFFVLWIVRNLLFWVGLWQDKEYRLDRLFVHFRETLQGKYIFSSSGNVLKWIFFFLYGFIVFHDSYSSFYEIALGSFFIFQGMIVIRDLYYRRIKRPTFTLKALAILFMSSMLIAFLLVFPLMETFFWLLVVDRILPLSVALFVFFFAFPTEIYEDIKISMARNKMQKLTGILVIAVSGSYGKTSTKEYISQILSRKFKVVKTPGSNNTPFGIANTILKKIHDDTQVFVVEMGAYKRGEIAELTQIVRPQISVTTAISDQHISLYGSLKNVIESEYELIHTLPENGIALFNGNSLNIKKLYDRAKTEKIFYKCFNYKPKQKTAIGAYNIEATQQGTKFTALVKNKEFNCKTPLFGVHVVENILPAIYLADHLGFSRQEIIGAVSQFEPPAQTMVKVTLKNETVGMDDTFNASPESVMSAMDYLNLCKNKKIFVLSPLTELGKESGYRHYQIGKKAAQTCDYLFLLNKNFSKDVLNGVADGRSRCHVQISRPDEIAKIILNISKKGDMIIFEGKESKMVLKKLL